MDAAPFLSLALLCSVRAAHSVTACYSMGGGRRDAAPFMSSEQRSQREAAAWVGADERSGERKVVDSLDTAATFAILRAAACCCSLRSASGLWGGILQSNSQRPGSSRAPSL